MEGRVVFIAKLFEWVIFIWFADALYENRVWLSNCKIRGLRTGKEIPTEETRESYGISTGIIRNFFGKFSFASHSKRERGGNAGSAEISWEQVSCEKTTSGKLISKKGGCFTKEKEGGEGEQRKEG